MPEKVQSAHPGVGHRRPPCTQSRHQRVVAPTFLIRVDDQGAAAYDDQVRRGAGGAGGGADCGRCGEWVATVPYLYPGARWEVAELLFGCLEACCGSR